MQRPVYLFSVILLVITVCLSGCARKKFIPPESPAPTQSISKGEQIVKTAATQIGVRYTRGGTSPRSGFDCSGFVWWVYARHGIKLPRTTDEQARYGKAVNKDVLQAGDVLVFRPKKRSGLHNGIYVGKGIFIHSPSTGSSVRMESMEKGYWQQSYKGARRYL